MSIATYLNTGLAILGWAYIMVKTGQWITKNALRQWDKRRKESRRHVVLNPAILPGGLEQREYMDICCAMIRCADAVFMLRGWEGSEGAVAEHALAKKMGLKIITEQQERAA